MSDQGVSQTKEVPAERWSDWCITFTSGNRGRKVTMSFFDDVYGDEVIVDDAEFVAIDYDPVNKGNDIVVSVGDEEAPSGHVVPAPVKLWEAQDANGKIVSLQIEDQNSRRTILSFE